MNASRKYLRHYTRHRNHSCLHRNVRGARTGSWLLHDSKEAHSPSHVLPQPARRCQRSLLRPRVCCTQEERRRWDRHPGIKRLMSTQGQAMAPCPHPHAHRCCHLHSQVPRSCWSTEHTHPMSPCFPLGTCSYSNEQNRTVVHDHGPRVCRHIRCSHCVSKRRE